MARKKIKMADFEDTLLWRVKIVSINVESINYIDKFSEKKMVFGLKSGGRYYVDASISNLHTLIQFGLVGINWQIVNYPEKYCLLEVKMYGNLSNKHINKKGDKK